MATHVHRHTHALQSALAHAALHALRMRTVHKSGRTHTPLLVATQADARIAPPTRHSAARCAATSRGLAAKAAHAALPPLRLVIAATEEAVHLRLVIAVLRLALVRVHGVALSRRALRRFLRHGSRRRRLCGYGAAAGRVQAHVFCSAVSG